MGRLGGPTRRSSGLTSFAAHLHDVRQPPGRGKPNRSCGRGRPALTIARLHLMTPAEAAVVSPGPPIATPSSFGGSLPRTVCVLTDTLEAYTDGSCLSHPRRGGIGIRFVTIDNTTGGEITQDLSPAGYPNATNQEMEILACTTALREALGMKWPDSIRRLIIRTDSAYVQENYKRAIYEWPKQKWLRSTGGPVENAEDWKELAKWYKKAASRFEVVRIEWVEGHSNNPHNKAANRLAKCSARNPWNKPRKLVHVRRKHTAETVERGSVKMEGQRLTIRVFQSGILKVQKLWRCTYEVVSADSPYDGKVDVIFTDPANRLDAGHTYDVRVNCDNKNPRIVEVHAEVVPPQETESEQPTPDRK